MASTGLDLGRDGRETDIDRLWSGLPLAMITNKIYHFDAVLVTHEHYDHVGGLDDLRPFGRYKDVDIYAEDNVVEAIKTRIPYVFREHKISGSA